MVIKFSFLVNNGFMRKSVKILLFISIISTILFSFTACGTTNKEDYIRIHIRANSDSTIDQRVKLEVRDEIVAFITPLAKGVKSKSEMREVLQKHLPQIETLAEKVLKAQGFSYQATAYLGREDFPQKSYGDLTLDAGIYDALILNLGTGEGANWWCVAYPPLCFIASEDIENSDKVEYKSIIAEWFDKNS